MTTREDGIDPADLATADLTLRPAGWTYAVFGLGGLAVLGLLWPGALIEGWLWLQSVAAVATLAWFISVAALIRGRLRVSDGRLTVRLLRTATVDLRRLEWLALTPEAPPPGSARAGGYSMWGLALSDGAGAVSLSASPSLWSEPERVLKVIAAAVERGSALISTDNWAMLRSKAGLPPAPLAQPQTERGWAQRFVFNQRNAAAASGMVALLGLWPLAWVLLKVMAGDVGGLEVFWLVVGVTVLVYAWYDHRVGKALEYRMHPHGVVEVVRRGPPARLGIIREAVDLSRAVEVEAVPDLVVRGQVHSYLLRVRDASGATALLPLGEGLVPPRAFWLQGAALLRRSGVSLPPIVALQIAKITGERPDA